MRELLTVPADLKALGVRAFVGEVGATLPGYRLLMSMGLIVSSTSDVELTILVDCKSADFTDERMGEVRRFAATVFFEGVQPSKWANAEGKNYRGHRRY